MQHSVIVIKGQQQKATLGKGLTIRPLVELKEYYVKGQIQAEKVGNSMQCSGSAINATKMVGNKKTINTTLGKGSATKGLVTRVGNKSERVGNEVVKVGIQKTTLRAKGWH
jgi:hypothetical protein